MSALKSVCSLNVWLRLKSACCTAGKYATSSATYSTDGSADPEERLLAGRKRVYEPDYLDKLKPVIPQHDQINIKLVGYDFVVLERLQSLLHRYLKDMDIETEGYAVRAESWHVQRFAPRSSTSVADFHLKQYQRVLQVSDVPSTKLGTVIELLQGLAPPGVTCTVNYHTEEDEKVRYIPDLEMKALQNQLEELGGPSKLQQQRDRQAQFLRK